MFSERKNQDNLYSHNNKKGCQGSVEVKLKQRKRWNQNNLFSPKYYVLSSSREY